MMQPLTKVMQGTTCTVKWALGLPDIIEKLRELKIEQRIDDRCFFTYLVLTPRTSKRWSLTPYGVHVTSVT